MQSHPCQPFLIEASFAVTVNAVTMRNPHKITIAKVKIVLPVTGKTKNAPTLPRGNVPVSFAKTVTARFTGKTVMRLTRQEKTVCARGLLNAPTVVKCISVTRNTRYKATSGNCGQYRDINHRCFIQRYVVRKAQTTPDTDEEVEYSDEEEEVTLPKKTKPEPLVVAFDIECSAEDVEGCNDKVFKPVLIGWSMLGEVDDYHEVKTVVEFLEEMRPKTYVLDQDREVYCFAHNLRAFDGLFIQKELYKQGYSIHSIFNQGAKYLSFQCGNLIFRDSMNFFSMPLEKLSATFNLRELHKGYFPYSWIRQASEGYKGPFPPTKDYNPDRMSEKRRKEFHTWYVQQQGKTFHYNKELSLYLKRDVLVLREVLQAFATEMFNLTEVKPLTQCVTIASTAFRVWQQNFLKPKHLIALEPRSGWRFNQVNQSAVALEWLEWENAKIGGQIQVCINEIETLTFVVFIT